MAEETREVVMMQHPQMKENHHNNDEIDNRVISIINVLFPYTRLS